MRTVILLFTGFGLLAAGDVIPVEPGYPRVVLEYGAFGALIASFAYLLRVEIPAMRKQNENQQTAFGSILNRISDRWDGWEKIRHDDHESLQNVLRDVVVNCASTRSAMYASAARDAERAHTDADRSHDDKTEAHDDAERKHQDMANPPPMPAKADRKN